jgi:hypothetical protein
MNNEIEPKILSSGMSYHKMKYTYLMLILLAIACNTPQKKSNNAKMAPAPAFLKEINSSLLQANGIEKIVAANHEKLMGHSGDFISFKKYISALNDAEPTSIPFALDYIETCLPAALPERDSVVLLFNVKFYTICNKLSEDLDTKYGSLTKQLEKDVKSPELSAFQNNLKVCGIGVFSTEGNYYLDVLPNYFYDNFKDRVSEGTKTYLNIRKQELAEGFTEDAGLLISYKQLYQRVKNWDKYLSTFPKNVYTGEADGYYTTYLETFLTGTDNSRVFDGEDETISPEIKKLYEIAIHDDAQTRTGKIIAQYYALLSRHQFKQTDSIDVFLKTHNLSTMLAVQPHTR